MSSDYLPSDVAAVFDHENWSKITGQPDPTLYADVTINGGGGLNGGAFAEGSIDTQSKITGDEPGSGKPLLRRHAASAATFAMDFPNSIVRPSASGADRGHELLCLPSAAAIPRLRSESAPRCRGDP